MPDVFDRLEGALSSQAIKKPCSAATAANITLSGLQTIDGVALAENDRVLVRAQNDTTQNGIYVAATSTWDRALDFDGNTDFVNGCVVTIALGTVYGGQVFRVNSPDPQLVGENAITFDLVDQDPSASITTIPAATTTDLGSTASESIIVSGDTNISSFGSSAPTGVVKTIRFTGTPTLVHGASLLLPTETPSSGGQNIVVAAGDRAIVRHEGSGVWIVLTYTRVNGQPLITGVATIASAATTDLGSTIAQSISITGSTPITSFGTGATGATKFVSLEGAILLTHSASLILPGGVSIQGASGDTFIAKYDGSNIWRVLNYTRALPSQLSITPVSNSATSEQTLMQQVIAAGRLASARNYVKVKAWGNCSTASTAAPRRVRLGFGGTFVVESGASIPAGANWALEAIIAYVTTSAQVASGTILYSTSATGGGSIGTIVTGPAENPAGAINVLLNSITTGGTGQLTAYGLLVEVV